MSKTREILRLRWALGRSVRESARASGLSAGAVSKTESRARNAGVTWAAVEGLDDEQLERKLYGGPKHSRTPKRAVPDPLWTHAELRRPGVTLELLHLEYLREHPDGYRYTAFCDVYRRWLDRRGLVMRQQHNAGERAFVDYSGKQPKVIDPSTGEVIEVDLFVAVLGASNLTYAEAKRTQTIGDFVRSHVHAFEYFGGAPKVRCPISFAAPCARRAGNSRRSRARTPSSDGTTERRSCPLGRGGLATMRKSRSACRSPSAGSSRGSDTRPSSPSSG